MPTRLDRWVNTKALICAFPAVFLIHDLEEVLTTEGFLRENRDRLPLPSSIKTRVTVTTNQFALAVTFLFGIVSAISYLAARSLKPGRAMQLFAAITSLLFLNVFTHLGQSLLVRRPTPGVVTAVTVGLPYSLYTLRRLRREKLIGEKGLPRTMVTAALLGLPTVLSAHAVGRLAARWRSLPAAPYSSGLHCGVSHDHGPRPSPHHLAPGA